MRKENPGYIELQLMQADKIYTMTHTELRIGNKVLRDGIGREVGGVSKANLDKEEWVIWEEAVAYPLSKYEPIRLTPELVQYYGFKHSSGSQYECKHLIDFVFTVDLFDETVNITPGGMFDETYGIDIKCSNLHTLQNIFFELTGGEELKPLPQAIRKA